MSSLELWSYEGVVRRNELRGSTEDFWWGTRNLEVNELVDSLLRKSWLERFSQGIEVVDVETSLEELVGHRVDISRIPITSNDNDRVFESNR